MRKKFSCENDILDPTCSLVKNTTKELSIDFAIFPSYSKQVLITKDVYNVGKHLIIPAPESKPWTNILVTFFLVPTSRL